MWSGFPGYPHSTIRQVKFKLISAPSDNHLFTLTLPISLALTFSYEHFQTWLRYLYIFLQEFHPNITAFQALFHKIGRAWHNVQLFSAHHGQELALREITSCDMPLIYAGSKYPAHLLAKEIIQFDSNQSKRNAVMAEFLSVEGKERIIQGSLENLANEKFSPTSILLILPWQSEEENREENAHNTLKNITNSEQEKAVASLESCHKEYNENDYLRTQILPLGLPEQIFAKENNLITASDARAIIISRLRLPSQGHLWDLGAGSGSVGLEAAALCPKLQVHAIEQKNERVALIEKNRKALGVVNYTAYHAKITEIIPSLIIPQRIFIGGGGKDLPQIMNLCAEKLSIGGIIVVSAVTLESLYALHSWQETHNIKRTACLRINIAHETAIAGNYHHFKEQNTLYIFTYTKD